MSLCRPQELKDFHSIGNEWFIHLTPTLHGTLAVIDKNEQLYTINCLTGATTEGVKHSYICTRLLGLSNGSVLLTDNFESKVFDPVTKQFFVASAEFKKQDAFYPIISRDGDVALRMESKMIFFKEDKLDTAFASISLPYRIMSYCYLGDHHFVVGCDNGRFYVYKRDQNEYRFLFETVAEEYQCPRLKAVGNHLLILSPFHNKVSMWQIEQLENDKYHLSKINENNIPNHSEFVDSPELSGHFVTSYSACAAHESRILIWDAEKLIPVEEIICKELVRSIFCISKSQIAVCFIHKNGVDVYQSQKMLDYQKKIESDFRKILEQDLDIPKVHVNIIAEYLNHDIALKPTQCPLTIFSGYEAKAYYRSATSEMERKEENEKNEELKSNCCLIS